MLNLYPLYSSSSGNMYFIESGDCNILVDIGVSYKNVKLALDTIGKEVKNLNALFITHEHVDHIKGLNIFIKNNPDIPVYCSFGTYNYIKKELESKNIIADSLNIVTPELDYYINSSVITPFSISHDAIDPIGYKIKNDNKCITIATDLGTVTNSVFTHLKDSSLAVIESNYDKELLFAGSYPFDLKRRINGPYGHLSNEDSGQVILNLAKEGKREFILGHMSENNNMPLLAKEYINSTLSLAGFNLNEFNINLATKEFSTEVYSV